MPGTQAAGNLGRDAGLAALMARGLGGRLELLFTLTPHYRDASVLQPLPSYRDRTGHSSFL